MNVPDWPRDAVFYQILPDRFADGDPSSDTKKVKPWDAPPSGARQGGDLAGVLERFDYLRDLGVNALYFNPLFKAHSYHAYDPEDHRKIDPHFGTLEQYRKLVGKAHAHGWHVILDGVFHHTGVNFFAFRSLREEGEKSPYKDWFFPKQFPIEVKRGQQTYADWRGTYSMPNLNLNNPDTRWYLMDVATYWVGEEKADGWRLDGGNEVDPNFWREFRQKVREANPEAFIIGEVWENASQWLQGDQFGSVMNYRWRGAALDFFATKKTTPTQFDQALKQIRDDYPPAAVGVLLNMLSSHDVDRLRTSCNGDRAAERQLALLQLTYPGVPSIYYGDEIGMEGSGDPGNRHTMIWDESRWDTDLHAFYKRLIALRRKETVLRRGDYRTVLLHDDHQVFGYLRSYGSELALVLFNRSDSPQQAQLPAYLGEAGLRDWLGTKLRVKKSGSESVFEIPAHGFALLGC